MIKRFYFLLFALLLMALTQGASAAVAPYFYYTATSGTNGASGNESFHKLVDDDKSTKWCVTSLGNPTYIEFHSAEPIVPVGYIMTTGNDTQSESGRNPKNWKILAKAKSGDAWTTLVDVQNNNEMPAANTTDKQFDIAGNTTAYQYFRLEISAIQSGSVFQLAEFQFLVQGEPEDMATITFKANGNTVTKEVELPHTFYCDYGNENEELDLIIKELYEVGKGWCVRDNAPTVTGSDAVTSGVDGPDGYRPYITISEPFEGTVTVTGRYYKMSYFDYSLEVTCALLGRQNVKQIAFPKTHESLNVGKTLTLTPVFTPHWATDKTITYTTSDANVATVNAAGVVTGVAPGCAMIIATATNGTDRTQDDKADTCFVAVSLEGHVPVYKETLSTYDDAYGKNITIKTSQSGGEDGVVVRDSNPMIIKTNNGDTITSVVLRIGWYSGYASTFHASHGTCTVSGSGNGGTYVTISGINAPEVEIGCEISRVNRAEVYYGPFWEVENLEIPRKVGFSQIGQTRTLTPTFSPAGPSDTTIEWASSDPAVATVANGVITAVAKGTALITATATNGTADTADDKTDTCFVTVVPFAQETYIRMGTYNGEYVDWFAARSNANGWVMLSKHVLRNMKFGSNSTYTQSNIYKWLDADAGGTFEDDLGLTPTERSLVKVVDLTSTAGDATSRFIIPHRTNEQPNGSPYTKAYYIDNKSSLCGRYWLREPRDGTNARVINGSDATVTARYSNPGSNLGVRPMFYLGTDSLGGLAFTGSGTEADPYVFEPRYELAADVTPAAGATISAVVTKDNQTLLSRDLPGKLLASEAEGATVTLTVTPNNGYSLNSITVMSGGAAVATTGEDNTRTFTMPAADVAVKLELSLATDATGAYLIRSLADWELFCHEVNGGNTFSGKTVKMTANVSGVTTRTSTNLEKPFSGTFDGQGHTLNLNINVATADATAAPFGYINGATIQNLHITGSETTAGMRIASIVGFAKASTITNCWSEVALSSSKASDIDCGAFVARTESGSTVTLNGCLFTGSITYSNANGYEGGGMVGWARGTVVINDCMFAPSSVNITKYNKHNMFIGNASGTVNNSYYNEVAAKTSLSVQGKRARIIEGGSEVTVSGLGEATATYNMSGITAYAKGIKYNNVCYAGAGDEVALTLTPAVKMGQMVGEYTVGTKVSFAKGNLQAAYNGTAWKWQFAENQWDYVGNAPGNTKVTAAAPFISENDTVDVFGWVGASSTWTDVNQHGITSSAATNNTNGYGNVADESLKSDWGTLMASGWYTLSKDEWDYILNTRTVNGGKGSGKSYTLGQKVNDKLGLVIYPDDYTGAVYTGTDWETFEAAGCVFLPAAGWRNGTTMNNVNARGFYWTSTPNAATGAHRVFFTNSGVNLETNARNFGFSVRLANNTAAGAQLPGRFTCGESGTLANASTSTPTLTMIDANQTIDATWVADTNFIDNGDGTYTIKNSTGWEKFCDLLEKNAGGFFTGKTVKLDADINITRSAGVNNHDFTGTFDGQGHTIDANLTSTAQYSAPFYFVVNGAVKNLKVTGTIASSAKFASGLVGGASGTVDIVNCIVSAAITSSLSGDATNGGIVANVGNNANLTIEGCAFTGKLLTTNGTTYCGGIVGWGKATQAIRNSIYAPAAIEEGETEVAGGCATFSRNVTGTLTNSFYTRTFGTAQGKQALSITAGTDVTSLAISGESTEYNVSGITAFGNGLKFGDTYYAGEGDVVELALTHADKAGYTFSEYSATAGTLSGTTLTMADGDVTINAVWAKKTHTLDETADNEAWLSENDGLLYDITLTRTLQTGSYNTFSVPFNIPASKYGEYNLTSVKKLTDSEFNNETGVLTLTFADEETGIEAGKPYLVKVSAVTANPLFEDVTISATATPTVTAVADLIPTMGATTIDGEAKSILFLGGGNSLYNPTAENQQIKGFRAFFKLKGDATQARAFGIDFTDGELTGIQPIGTNDGARNGANYTLDGRRLQGQPRQKGVYIVNGKKKVIK